MSLEKLLPVGSTQPQDEAAKMIMMHVYIIDKTLLMKETENFISKGQ